MTLSQVPACIPQRPFMPIKLIMISQIPSMHLNELEDSISYAINPYVHPSFLHSPLRVR